MTDIGNAGGRADDGANADRAEQEEPAGFEAFVELLRDRLNLRLDGAPVTPELRLAEDLGFDSVAMFELFVLLEDAAARELPYELLDNVETMADAWNWYSTLLDQHNHR